jgi:nitrate reductase NapAB chaperone NapD
MTVASGFVVANEPADVKNVVESLKAGNIEVNDIKEDRITFLIERETVNEVKSVLDSLKDIDGVRSVYLAYYSLPGSDASSDNSIEELLPISSN